MKENFRKKKGDAFNRSDEQRSVKQKERKERELEYCSFNAERMEEAGMALVIVITN